MKVSISHEEVKKGLVFKSTKYQVSVDVDFTEEEKLVMNQNNIRLQLFNRHDYRGGSVKTMDAVYAGQFEKNKKPIVTVLDTPAKAQALENDFKENLVELKERIDYCSQEKESSTFEL